MASKVHETITKIMIQKIEKRRAEGELALPWRMTWNPSVGAPRSLKTDKAYRGCNLWLTGMQGYSTPLWVTRKQCAELGGSIKAGESYTPIIFWSFPTDEQKAAAKAGGKTRSPFVRFYQVWNAAAQCEGLEKRVADRLAGTEPINTDPIEACEKLLRYAGRPELKHGGGRACYSPSQDIVRMPEPISFESMKDYYHCRFHEESHATGHRKRLNRDGIVNPITFASHAYSGEELIAEMSATMLASHAGIGDAALEDNSAAYLDSWLRKLKADPSLLIQSGAAAQRAVDHIRGITWGAK